MTRLRLLAILVSASALVAVAPAQQAQFWFARQGDATAAAITEVNIGASAGSFSTVSLWARTTSAFPFPVASAYLTYDSLSSAVDADGEYFLTDQPTTQNKIRLGGGPNGVINRSSLFSTWDAFYAAAPSSTTYGISVVGLTDGGTVNATTAIRLFDINVENIGLTLNQTATLSLLDRGTGDEFTSFLQGNDVNTTILRPGTQNLLVRAVPEPATLIAFGMGGLALLRRRKK